jgi:hypothetical protein
LLIYLFTNECRSLIFLVFVLCLSLGLRSGDELFGVRDAFNSHLLSDLQNLLAAFGFFQSQFKVSVVYPGSGNICKLFTVFLVYHAYTIQLTEMLFHFDIGLEHFLFRVQAYGSAEDLAGFVKIVASEAEVSVEDP